MPGASMIGTLAHSAMSRVASPATRQVTVVRAPLSMPVAASMSGWTKIM